MPNESEFDLEMASMGRVVYLYDGTIERPAQDHVNFRFKPENVDSSNLIAHLVENGDFGKTNLTLKMDIEGSEYETLLNCDERIFDHFSQIAIEVHDLLESLGVDQPPFSPMYSAQIRSSRTFLQKQIPSSHE